MTRMASFLVGLGGGYIKAKDKQYERDKEANEDAWRNEQRGRQRTEWADADKLKTDLAAASKPMTMEQGAGGMVKPEEMDNRDVGLPENAALPNGGLMLGGYKVGGESFTDKAKANEALVKMNTPEAIGERQAMAYQQNGKIQEANAMRAVLMDMKLKQMGLSEAEAKHADTTFNRMLSTKVPMGKGWGANFAKVLTETGVGGLKGVNFDAVYSPDGKTFELVGTGPDGTKVSKGTFTEDEQGWANAMRQANSASLETKIGYVVEAAQAKLAAEKLALDERKVAATEKKTDAMVYGLMNRGGGGGGGGRGGGGRGGGGQGGEGYTGMPDDMSGFDPRKAYATATDMAKEEFAQSGAPATPEAIAKRATAIYRGLESEFRASGQEMAIGQGIRNLVRMAKTPQQLQQVAQKAQAAGYSLQQLAAMDPRFAALAAPPAAATAVPQAAAPQPPTAKPAAPKANAFEPKNRTEYVQMQDAIRRGFEPAGRGNSFFGAGEILYMNPKTGERKYASQLFSK